MRPMCNKNERCSDLQRTWVFGNKRPRSTRLSPDTDAAPLHNIAIAVSLSPLSVAAASGLAWRPAFAIGRTCLFLHCWYMSVERDPTGSCKGEKLSAKHCYQTTAGQHCSRDSRREQHCQCRQCLSHGQVHSRPVRPLRKHANKAFGFKGRDEVPVPPLYLLVDLCNRTQCGKAESTGTGQQRRLSR